MLTRRGFLKTFGIVAPAAVVAPELLVPEEPRRRLWQVPTSAPVAYRGYDFGFGERSSALYAFNDDGVWKLEDISDQLDAMLYASERWRERAVFGNFDDTAPALREAFGNVDLPRTLEKYWLPSGKGYSAEERRLKSEAHDLYVQHIDHARKTITLGAEQPRFDEIERSRAPFDIVPTNPADPEQAKAAQAIVDYVWSKPKLLAELDRISGNIVRTLDAFGRPGLDFGSGDA